MNTDYNVSGGVPAGRPAKVCCTTVELCLIESIVHNSRTVPHCCTTVELCLIERIVPKKHAKIQASDQDSGVLQALFYLHCVVVVFWYLVSEWLHAT